MCFDGTLPVVQQTPIRLEQLDLENCHPIAVTSNGVDPQYWDLRVFAEDAQTNGTMTATMIDSNGGTFDSTIPVVAGFKFTGPGGTLYFRPFVEATLTGIEVPWVHEPPPFAICGNGGFFPGLTSQDPLCCDPSCYEGPQPGHAHCVAPPECPGCPQACCLPGGACNDMAPVDCEAQQGAPQGPGSTCAAIGECPDGDFDNDGDVDLWDFGVFQQCFGQTGLSPLCAIGDFDADDTIDLDDYGVFQAWLTGP